MEERNERASYIAHILTMAKDTLESISYAIFVKSLGYEPSKEVLYHACMQQHFNMHQIDLESNATHPYAAHIIERMERLIRERYKKEPAGDILSA